MDDNPFKDEIFEEYLDSYELFCTNYRRKIDNKSIYLNLIGSDFKEKGAIKVFIYGKNDDEEINCTNRVEYYYLEGGLKYELYNEAYENNLSYVQIRFEGEPG